MIRNYGSIAIAGFYYQHVYAGWRIVQLLKTKTLISATFEGKEDLELRYRDGNSNIIEFIQVKTREEGLGRWTIAELARHVIVPMLQKGVHKEAITFVQFVATGESDQNLVIFKDHILPAIAKKEILDENNKNIVTALYKEIIKISSVKQNLQNFTEDELFSFLCKFRIQTRHTELDTLKDLTCGLLRQIVDKKGSEYKLFETIISKISEYSARKRLEERTVSALEFAKIIGIQWSPEIDAIEDLHKLKDPAEEWYVIRKGEDDLSEFIKEVSRGVSRNLLLTGASGIGKSSMLNHARPIADSVGVFCAKLRISDPTFNGFLQELVDVVIDQLESVGVNDVPHRQEHPKNRLLSILKAFRKGNNKTPIILMIDQFERLFEEKGVRIDESLMRDVWRQFVEFAAEVNSLGQISFIITARQHFFWVMFPSDTVLKSSGFRYITLERFSRRESEYLLDKLINVSGHLMNEEARELLVEKTDCEPQLIILSFINAFNGRKENIPMDFVELSKLQPWDEVFKRDIDAVCRDELQKLIIFAMANIERELCDLDEILERISLVNDYSREDVQKALLEIQNRHRLINRPKEEKYSFYHRKVSECIFRDYKMEFPEQWVDEGVIWDVNKMIAEQVRNHEKLGTLIGADHLRIIDNHRDRLTPDRNQLSLIIKSAVVLGINHDYWIKQDDKLCEDLCDFFAERAGESVGEVQRRVIEFLGKFGKEFHLSKLEHLVNIDCEEDDINKLVKSLKTNRELTTDIVRAMIRRGHCPSDTYELKKWLFLAILCDEDASWWFKSNPVVCNEILSTKVVKLLHYIDNKNLGNVVSAVVASGNESDIRMMIGYITEKIEDSKSNSYYNKDRKENALKLLNSFHPLLAKYMSTLLMHFQNSTKTKDVDELNKILKIFLNSYNEMNASQQKTVIETVEHTVQGIVNLAVNKNEFEFLRLSSSLIEKSGNPLLRKEILNNLAKRLLATSDIECICEAANIYVEQEELYKLEDPLYKISKILESNTGQESSPVVNLLKKILEKKPAKGFYAVIWGVMKSLLCSLARYNKLCFSHHSDLLQLYVQIINMLPNSASGFTRSIKTMKTNEFLKWELIANYILIQDRNGKKLSKGFLESTAEGYQKLDSKIEEEMELNDFRIKAESLMRYARICELLSNQEFALKLRKRGRNAFRLAISYFSNWDEKWEEYRFCIARSILSEMETDPNANLNELVKNIDSHDMKIVADELFSAGCQKEFSQAIKLTFEKSNSNDNGDVAYYAAEEWIDIVVKEGNWELTELCLDQLMYYDDDKIINNVLPIMIEVLDNPDKVEFLRKLYESDDWILIESLADGMAEHKRWNYFKSLCIGFFEKCDDDDSIYYAAKRWLDIAIANSIWDVAKLCMENLQDFDEFFDDLDENSDMLLKIFSRQQSSPELTEFKSWIVSSDYLFEFLADKLAEKGKRDEFSSADEEFFYE